VGVTATVYRQTELSMWQSLATVTGDGTGMITFTDAGVRPGASYSYRLGIREGGVEKFYGEARVTVPGLELALEGLRPNPASGPLTASFTLPNSAPARIQLLDVTGRVWLARDVGGLGAVSHLVGLDRSVPPGLYWLRLTQGGRSLLARAVVIR
jgi:hypothetical protein